MKPKILFLQRILLSGFLLLTTLSLFSQSQQLRVLDPDNPSQTYLYDIVYNGTVATVNRQIVTSNPSDVYGIFILGEGWSYNSTTQMLSFPHVPNQSWIGVDINFGGGDITIANQSSGEAEIICGCNGEGTCEAVKSTPRCYKCVSKQSQPCSFCLKPSLQNETIGLNSNFSFVLAASSVILNF